MEDIIMFSISFRHLQRSAGRNFEADTVPE
jgi:hypothetical protein